MDENPVINGRLPEPHVYCAIDRDEIGRPGIDMDAPDPCPASPDLSGPPAHRLAAPDPAEPAPDSREFSPYRFALGSTVLVACLLAGQELKTRLGLILPGNILGLFLLLALLALRIVPLRWVEAPARWLLWLLPLLFMPIFIFALKDRAFWLTRGPVLFATILPATILLWAVTGHLSQALFRRSDRLREMRGK